MAVLILKMGLFDESLWCVCTLSRPNYSQFTGQRDIDVNVHCHLSYEKELTALCSGVTCRIYG